MLLRRRGADSRSMGTKAGRKRRSEWCGMSRQRGLRGVFLPVSSDLYLAPVLFAGRTRRMPSAAGERVELL